MYKKMLFAFVLVLLILAGLYVLKNKNSAIQQTKPAVFEDKVYAYTAENLPEQCAFNSAMACAVEFTVKCTLNPAFGGCKTSKLPKFIFMEDESLKRPTEISFKIAKIKPINADLVEIHTDSTCNGNWFGLCNGRVIYVLVPDGNGWRTKDIYAIEN